MASNKILTLGLPLILIAGALAGCADEATNGETIQQAGSSTVLPIAIAWSEELAARGIQVAPAGGGSSLGASALCAGEIDIGDMSRPLTEEEIARCQANGIEPLEWEVAFDGITVVVNTENDFVDCLTTEELAHIWRSDDPALTWQDVRPTWPAEEIVLYGPDSDSGTYEYFVEEILGKDAVPRDDYTPSANDDIIVEGVSQSPQGLGYFGFAYYLENQDVLRAVPIVPEGEEGCENAVTPTFETIAAGTYTPLSRPIYMVTDGQPEPGTPLHAYFEYAMNEGQEIVPDVGYVALDEATLEEQRAWL